MAVAIPLALLAVSTVAAGAGTYEQAQSQGAAAKATANADTYQAQVAKNNATTASQNASAALAEGNLKVQQQQTAASQQLASIRAAMGANGIQLNSGSSLAVQSGVARANQQGIQATQFDALTQAIGEQNQAQDQYADSGLDTATASNALTGGSLAQTGTIISGVSGVASKWSGYLHAGTIPSDPGPIE